MKSYINIIFCLFFCFSILNATALKVEPSLIQGQLENGLKYTIKENSKPEKKASIRLLVEAGSLEEDDDQKGIAHLVEHMAFNGTEHFKGNDIIKFLESIGVGFGSHLNASTTTTRTLYTLEIPLKNDNLEKAMLIFSDWAGRIDFTEKELDKERGVVLEEARYRNNLRYRIYQQLKHEMYANSKYIQRDPIGDLDIVKNIKIDRVKAFYDDWYRPEFMHLVVVGDFDSKNIEKMIKEKFSDFKNNSKRKQATRDVEKIDKTRVTIAKDKEVISPSLNIYYYDDYKKVETEEDLKDSLVRTIMIKLFNQKASEQMLKKNPIATRIGLNSRRFATNLRTYSFSSSYSGINEIPALKEITKLMYTIEKLGFDKKDFQRVIKELKKQNNDSLKSLKNKMSKRYADQLASYALNKELFIDEKYEVELVNKLLDELTLSDINKKYKNILALKSRLAMYIVSPNVEVSKRRVKSILNNKDIDLKVAKDTKELPSKLSPDNLKPMKIVKETYDKKYDYYEFTLENGIKVVYKFNDYLKNSVSLNAFSKGGFSVYDTKDLPNAKFALKVIGRSGLDKYNFIEVNKIYADKSVRIRPLISRYGEAFSGSSTKKDFEYLLEHIYTFVTMYRFDDNVFSNLKNITLANIKREDRNPNRKFSNELAIYKYKGNERYKPTDEEDIKKLNKEDIKRIFADRFSDMNNFTFIIVGDISKDEVKKFSSLYLGNLPIKKRDENYKFRGIKPVSGEHEFIRNYSNENISSIALSYSKELPYSTSEAIYLSAFKDVLRTKLRELIREDKSGAYSVGVRTSFQREPYSKATVSISFTCDPNRKDELVKYIKQVISNIQKNEVEQKYIDSFVKKIMNSFDENRKTPKFWLNQLKSHYYYGDDLNKIEKYKDIYNSINPKVIKDIANKYLDTKDIFYIELNPKTMDE
ncbi:insulinase family protein [Halarcobacter sp.]|uniref:M16 family metallopeptidase n=1 Tax=Halarcobacter sp. TaxID=2321133 RepID=UPI002AA79696|nr:insulinase family protein [Halarcobacter sp.]